MIRIVILKELIMSKKELEYKLVGDYYIPNVALPIESEIREKIGKYGLLRLEYLKEYKKGYYTFLMLNGSVPVELRNIDMTAKERVKNIIKQLAEQENINEELKANDQMEWVKCMNNIKNRAEEIVLKELIYI